jgi:hypothetical protein
MLCVRVCSPNVRPGPMREPRLVLFVSVVVLIVKATLAVERWRLTQFREVACKQVV